MSTQRFRVRTTSGNVHSLTVGRRYSVGGTSYENSAADATGKADCGSTILHFASHLTTDPLTCTRCIAKA